MMLLPGPQGKVMHACIQIGDSAVMLADEFPDWGSFGPKSLKGSPVTIHLQVGDVDTAFKQAVGAGAEITMPLEDMFGAIAMASSKTRLAIIGRSPHTFAM